MKYLTTRTVNGRRYFYLRQELTRRSGRAPVVVTSHLGPTAPAELRPRLEAFFEKVAAVAAGMTEADGGGPFRRDSILGMERARFRYRCLHHELFEPDLDRFRRAFTVLFILNSNRAEGSRVVRRDIEETVSGRAAPRSQVGLEVLNSMAAMGYAFSGRLPWNPKGARAVHSLLFRGFQPEIAGRFRKVGIFVGDGLDPATSETVPWNEVPSRMSKLFAWLGETRRSRMYPPRMAVEFHWRFERIHPFEDGNGRTGRILMNALLHQNGYMPVVFNMNRTRSYSSAIARAIRGHAEPLASFFGEQTSWTVESVRKECEHPPGEPWRRRQDRWCRPGRVGILYD